MTRLNTLHIYASDNSIKFKIQKKLYIYTHPSQTLSVILQTAPCRMLGDI